MKPAIAGYVEDIMFQTRIESVANALDLEVTWLGNDERVLDNGRDLSVHLGEYEKLIEIITRISPIMIIFDLGNNSIPTSLWISILKKDPATRRIPIICFGSHIDVESFVEARKAGSDEVLARSRFVTSLKNLIEKYSHLWNQVRFEDVCEGTLHTEAIKGLELFNTQEFYLAHEHLESAWQEDLSLGRNLYQGLLQISVAYYQIQQQNFKGTIKMFQRARHWLNNLPDICRGINVDYFRKDAESVYREVLVLGPDGLKELPDDKFKPVMYESN